MGCEASKTPGSDPAPKTRESKASVDATRRYSTTSVNKNKAEITQLFRDLDANGDGGLQKSELRYVVEKFLGSDFDEAQFFNWFDVHGSGEQAGKEGSLDETEFGWFLGDMVSKFGKVPITPKLKAAIPEVIMQLHQLHNEEIEAKFKK